MLYEDYIMRTINLFFKMIFRILKLRQEDYREALQAIDELFKQLFGMGSRLFNTLPEEEILKMLSSENGLQPDKVLIAACLLQEEGMIYKEHLDAGESFGRLLKALNLMLTVLKDGHKIHLPRQYADPSELIGQLESYHLPKDTLISLAEYYERTGRYAKAEDVLYEALGEEYGDPEEWRKRIREFYRRLMAKEDSELAKGNLPRNEITDAMLKLEKEGQDNHLS